MPALTWYPRVDFGPRHCLRSFPMRETLLPFGWTRRAESSTASMAPVLCCSSAGCARQSPSGPLSMFMAWPEEYSCSVRCLKNHDKCSCLPILHKWVNEWKWHYLFNAPFLSKRRKDPLLFPLYHVYPNCVIVNISQSLQQVKNGCHGDQKVISLLLNPKLLLMCVSVVCERLSFLMGKRSLLLVCEWEHLRWSRQLEQM